MKGTVLDFDVAADRGLLRGEDGKRYQFSSVDWKDKKEFPRAGLSVDFEIDSDSQVTNMYFEIDSPNQALDIYCCAEPKKKAATTYLANTASPKPKRPALGCGGAIVLFFLIGLLGNLLPNLEPDKPTQTNIQPSPNQEQEKPSPQPSPPSKIVYYTKEGYYAAPTEELLDRMVEAASHKDVALLEKMGQAGLIYPVYSNQEVILTGCHGFICSTITFRYKGKLEEHWTVAEAIESRRVPIDNNQSSQGEN